MTDAITAENNQKESSTPEAQALVGSFMKITRFYVAFHIIFACIAFLEFFSLAVFFSFLITSSTIAFLLAAIFLTGFSYFVLLFYFQVKKPQQLGDASRIFFEACRRYNQNQELSTYHLSVSHAIHRVASALDKIECHYYRLPFHSPTIQTLLKKFSIFCHWKDVLLMKELLLLEAIKEHVSLIKEEPVDLEAHASLAESYMRLAAIYQKPHIDEDLFPWISPEYSSEEMKKKCHRAYARAIEEFSIIDTLAPNDPWVHAQLAEIYRQLNDPQKEILQYETILRIVPHDHLALFKLGVLYFKQGHTALGLRIYQQLKQTNNPRSEHLLSYYDAFKINA